MCDGSGWEQDVAGGCDALEGKVHSLVAAKNWTVNKRDASSTCDYRSMVIVARGVQQLVDLVESVAHKELLRVAQWGQLHALYPFRIESTVDNANVVNLTTKSLVEAEAPSQGILILANVSSVGWDSRKGVPSIPRRGHRVYLNTVEVRGDGAARHSYGNRGPLVEVERADIVLADTFVVQPHLPSTCDNDSEEDVVFRGVGNTQQVVERICTRGV